jgi:hypothetical protein
MGLVILGIWNRASGNIAGEKRSLARVVEGGVGHFCLVFRNEHTLRRAIQVSQISKLNLNNYTTVPSRYLCPREELDVFLIHLGNLFHFRCLFCVLFLGPGPRDKGML